MRKWEERGNGIETKDEKEREGKGDERKEGKDGRRQGRNDKRMRERRGGGYRPRYQTLSCRHLKSRHLLLLLPPLPGEGWS